MGPEFITCPGCGYSWKDNLFINSCPVCHKPIEEEKENDTTTSETN